MKEIFALETLPKFLFLAGPTPRSPSVASWRREALDIIAEIGFSGTVLVPEQRDWRSHENYDGQIGWEWEGLNMATCVVFWVPREIQKLPGFTTNVEFGLVAAQGKVVFGYPSGSPKMKYLSALAKRYGIDEFQSLRETLAAGILKAEMGFVVPSKDGI